MRLSQPDSVNVLLSDANWAWPQAVSQIFQPQGINAMVAQTTDDVVQIIDNSKIHLAILDAGWGVQALKIVRKRDNLLPCLLLAQDVNDRLLAQALKLKVFSVLAKPVDMHLLADQIKRIFQKYYAIDVFSDSEPSLADQNLSSRSRGQSRKISAVIQWRKNKKSE